MFENLSADLILSYTVEYGTALFFAIAIFYIGKMLAKWITSFAQKAMSHANLDETLIKFLGNIIYALLLAFVIIAALSQLGIETTSLAAIIAAAGLAIGLALQGSLANLASGVMIILFRPFKVGDYIAAGGTEGTVEEVNIFTTHLVTLDNKSVVLPNGTVTGGAITNFSNKEVRRVDFIYGISYGDDIKEAQAVFEKVLAAHPLVVDEPKPEVFVIELADSSVNFAVRPWCKSEHYWDVFGDITGQVKIALDDAGISIPFPQRDVHLFNEK